MQQSTNSTIRCLVPTNVLPFSTQGRSLATLVPKKKFIGSGEDASVYDIGEHLEFPLKHFKQHEQQAQNVDKIY